MKNLQHIFTGIEGINLTAQAATIQASALVFDSRDVQANSVFFALKGTSTDGHAYIQKAIDMGAKVIVFSDEKYLQQIDNVLFIKVQDVANALAIAAKNFYNNPSQKLKLIGITGTNGKTTTVTLLYNLFTLMGEKCGLISTVKYLVADKEYPSTHTTPDVLRLNELLSQMVAAKCEYVFMEVSSHAIHQKRIEGLTFAGGVFTNITHDHLDYHKTFKEYIHTKKAFFDQLSPSAFALTNIDDRNGEIMIQNTKSTVYKYALKSLAHFKAKVLSNSMQGMELEFNGDSFYTHNVGVYNCYNLLVTYSVSLLLNKDKALTLSCLSKVKGAKGRFETIINPKNNISAIVDYAHTGDALEKLLKAIQDVKLANQHIITVIGCGGDRDKTKRPEMAKIAAQLSDFVYVTSDNPRTEDPEAIIDDMWVGIEEIAATNVARQTDRKQAIAAAIAHAQPNDIVVVAGKGHENYQEIMGIKHEFDDLEIIKQVFNFSDNF